MSRIDSDRIIELRKLIHYYNKEYYVNNKSLVSDLEFDVLLKELESLETKYPDLFNPNSPTQRVGGDITKSFDSVQHKSSISLLE